jgi:hypothetical protein
MHPLALGVRLGEFRQQVTSLPITSNDIGWTTQTKDMLDDMLSISLRICVLSKDNIHILFHFPHWSYRSLAGSTICSAPSTTISPVIVANDTKAQTVAQSPFVETKTTLAQAEQLMAAAIAQAGGFGVPCTKSVPFIVVPGLVMQTVVGAVYPKGFTVAVQTASPPAEMEDAISAMVRFTAVANSGPDVLIEIQGFPMAAAGTAQRRGAAGCLPGKEWRYSQLGAPPQNACKCPPNPTCSGGTSCSFQPQANESWLVIAADKSLCAPNQPQDDNLGLGIGLGLGLGIPFVLLLSYLFISVRSSKQKTVERPEIMDSSLEQQDVRLSPSGEIVFVDMPSTNSDIVTLPSAIPHNLKASAWEENVRWHSWSLSFMSNKMICSLQGGLQDKHGGEKSPAQVE